LPYSPACRWPSGLTPPAKAKPANCEQLADNKRFSNNLADPDIKALKAKCDAEKKTVAEPDPSKSN
jgi:hypothetical protein